MTKEEKMENTMKQLYEKFSAYQWKSLQRLEKARKIEFRGGKQAGRREK